MSTYSSESEVSARAVLKTRSAKDMSSCFETLDSEAVDNLGRFESSTAAYSATVSVDDFPFYILTEADSKMGGS